MSNKWRCDGSVADSGSDMRKIGLRELPAYTTIAHEATRQAHALAPRLREGAEGKPFVVRGKALWPSDDRAVDAARRRVRPHHLASARMIPDASSSVSLVCRSRSTDQPFCSMKYVTS